MLPVPVAAAGYGALLGLGFTTFILTFAVWALAGIAVALGDPGLGLALGLAFGAGRALPVIAFAPAGAAAVTAAMCERPANLRGLRRVDALAMAACALALAVSPPAGRPAATAPANASATSAIARAGADAPARGARAPATAPAGTLTAHR